jgi:hypothetical protein
VGMHQLAEAANTLAERCSATIHDVISKGTSDEAHWKRRGSSAGAAANNSNINDTVTAEIDASGAASNTAGDITSSDYVSDHALPIQTSLGHGSGGAAATEHHGASYAAVVAANVNASESAATITGDGDDKIGI